MAGKKKKKNLTTAGTERVTRTQESYQAAARKGRGTARMDRAILRAGRIPNASGRGGGTVSNDAYRMFSEARSQRRSAAAAKDKQRTQQRKAAGYSNF